MAVATLAAPAAAVTYTFDNDGFDIHFSVTTAAPITGMMQFAIADCGDGYGCEATYRAANAPGFVDEAGLTYSSTIADSLVVSTPGSSFYAEFATGDLSLGGDHVVGSSSLSVSGAPVSATQTSYSYTDLFGNAISWTTAAPITGEQLVRAETCSTGGVVRYNCDFLFAPDGSPATTFGPEPIPASVGADNLWIGLGGNVPWEGTGEYTAASYAPGAFTTPGVHSQPGFNALTVSMGAVPEPAGWAMMILGFGLVGAAQRRRSGTLAVCLGG